MRRKIAALLEEHILLLRALTRNLHAQSKLMEEVLAIHTDHPLRTRKPAARNRFGPISRDLVDSIRPLPRDEVAVVPRGANDPEAVAQRQFAKRHSTRKKKTR